MKAPLPAGTPAPLFCSTFHLRHLVFGPREHEMRNLKPGDVMPNLILPPAWQGRERDCTPQSIYQNRRAFLKRLGLGTIGLGAGSGLAGCASGEGGSARKGAIQPPEVPGDAEGGTGLEVRGPLQTIPTDAPREGYPAPTRMEGIPGPGRPLTERLPASSYNNFYEFKNQGNLKDCWRETEGYDPYPMTIEVRGLVEQPFTIGIEELIREMELEERIYRFRCVEAWSMTIPWTGFPLRKLVERCKPLSSATHLRFVCAERPQQMPGLASSPWYPWPYFEGLRMDEAMNELAFVVTGMYGEPLPKQNGSPVRMALPWKYGYKGPKAFVRLEFVDEEPPTFWHELEPSEYGFLSNVNPFVPHPRWSQATEKFIQSDSEEPERVETLLFNGYAEQVAALYPDEPREPTRPMAR